MQQQQPPPQPQTGTRVYIVYCPRCDDLHRGNVVIQCPGCRGADLDCFHQPNAFTEDPTVSRVPATCHLCHKQVLAVFSARCVACNERAVPLPENVTVNRTKKACVWCHRDDAKLVVDLLPQRVTACTDCMAQNIVQEFHLNHLYRVRGAPYFLMRNARTLARGRSHSEEAEFR